MSSHGLYASGFSKTTWMETLRIRDHVPNVLFDRKHGIRFLLSDLSVVVDDPPTANMMDQQEICPCPYLCPYISPFRRKGKLVHWLGPATR